MKISYNWLKEYADVNIPPVEVARILTDCGLEVEAIEAYESLKGGLKGVVVGKVLETKRHPNADKLTCCKVDIGKGEVLDIVCGAPNVAAGQMVPVATIGTELYKGNDSFTIKAGKLRGEPSNGMICAEDELGLGDSHAGIMVLDENALPGTPAADYFGVYSDTILEVAITPNRSDATSHIGVARDLVAAISNREKQHDTIGLISPKTEDFYVDNQDLPVEVVVENPEACPRYSGITMSGIQVKESPAWLRDRLKSIGLRPINSIVDITNFILMETGQPLHAFDAAEITGNKVVVRKVAGGTKFVTLDGVERTLEADDLMICNANEPMCIAGVFGGVKSGVTASTTSIFIESAYFDPTHIRKTSKFHGLKTDASFRFERGADPNITIYALKRAALLIREIAGGYISSEIVDVYPSPLKHFTIEVSYQRMNALIGKNIDKDTVKNILLSLEIEILSENEEGLTLSVPPFKVDVTREADVVEEILRIYGYNNIETSDSVHSSLSYNRKPDPEKLQQQLSDFLSNNGFNEILTNSLTSSAYYENSEVFSSDRCVKILNPLSNELGVMRQTLIYSGLESISHNINRRMTNLRFYEFGNTYSYDKAEAKNGDFTKKYHESKKLAVFVIGDQQDESWYMQSLKTDYYFLKSFIFAVLRKAGIPLFRLKSESIDTRLFAEGESFGINGMALVSLGRLNVSVLRQFDIKQDVFYAEVDWSTLVREVKAGNVKFSEVPRFPEVRRDLALLLDSHVKFAEIEALAYRNGKGILRAVNLFDVYEGEKLGEGKKSYAVSFTMQDESKTLTDNEIEKLMKRLSEVFEKELGATIRK